MDIRATRASLLQLAPTWHMPAHRHEGMHELIVVLAGRIETAIRGERLAGGPGSALLYPAGTAHEEWARGGALQTVCIGWRGEAPAGALLRSDRSGRIAELARWLAELAGETGTGGIADGLMAGLLHEFARPGDPGRDGLLARVRAWALPRLARPINLDDLAGAAGLSRFHFLRRFRAAAGCTPMRWLRRQRLQAARSLLLSSAEPLRSIAGKVGFADEFQLSRVFRREFGQAPSGLRSR